MITERKPLVLEDRSKIDAYLPHNHFYSYFPLIWALMLSEGAQYFFNIRDTDLSTQEQLLSGEDVFIWTDQDKLLLNPMHGLPESYFINEVMFSDKYYPSSKNLNSILISKDYIYNLNEVTNIKNIRMNIKKLTNSKYFSDLEYDKDHNKLGLNYVLEWYKQRIIDKNEDQSDFGYTIELVKNFSLFKDLHSRILTYNDKVVAYTLWGELNTITQRAIHIVLKCNNNIPYLADYLRDLIYKEMISAGFTTVSDGDDLGNKELTNNKLKRRPSYIIPIYSWLPK